MPIEVNENGELITPLRNLDNIRSESMQEIISKNPGFFSRWALFIFLFILTCLISATWFIHYPDIIKGRAILTGTNIPKEIYPLVDARLIKLFVKDDNDLLQGATVGFLESSTNHDHVFAIENLLDTIFNLLKTDSTQKITNIFADTTDNVGELQPAYQQFTSSFQQFRDYLLNGFFYKKKLALIEDLELLQSGHKILMEQREILKKDLGLTENNYRASESLSKENIISKQDQRIEESKLLNKQLTIPQINSSILSNETLQKGKIKEILELEHNISLQKEIFIQAVQIFKSQILEWKRKYILMAPISGRIVFQTPLQDKLYLKANKLVALIIPDSSSFYVEVNLPQYNFGKIDTGQNVQIRLDAYPYQEYGYLSGQINYISKIATDSGFVVHIKTSSDLKTNLNKTIQFRSGLKSEVLIITKEMRLIDRFISTIALLFDR
ncbi:MAG: HlyD family efflux transporter periplasmic adaptor subunit [Sediminibacterium sp.]|nr:HlyD family efflux transporter periplasmic adaptor subunit [Sediminibacterium sp.]